MDKDIQNSPLESPVPELKPFMPEFLNTRRIEIKEIKSELEKENFTSLKKYAHQWKGFSRPYGFGQLEAYSLELEKNANNNDLQACNKNIQLVEEYLEAKSSQISEL